MEHDELCMCAECIHDAQHEPYYNRCPTCGKSMLVGERCPECGCLVPPDEFQI